MIRRAPWTVLAGLVLLTTATAADPAKDKVDVRGTITRVTPVDEAGQKAGRLGVILVEGVKDATTEHDKASVRVTNKTRIEKLAGKERKPAKFADLKKGVRVQARFTGPVAESYPVQATAGEILILEEAK
jgi:hypothetical protein